MRFRALALAMLCALVLPPAHAAAVPDVDYSLDVSATTVQVGDTLTITPVVTGAEPGTVVRCAILIGRATSIHDWVRMRVARVTLDALVTGT